MASNFTSRNVAGCLLEPQALSDILRVRVGTLANWRSNGQGPPFYRVGRHVRYNESEVHE